MFGCQHGPADLLQATGAVSDLSGVGRADAGPVGIGASTSASVTGRARAVRTSELPPRGRTFPMRPFKDPYRALGKTPFRCADRAGAPGNRPATLPIRAMCPRSLRGTVRRRRVEGDEN